MKISILRNALWSSAVAATVATLSFSLPATAQTDTTTTPDTTTTAPIDNTGVVEDDNDGFDWGLLGLLGLIGLAGLARKPDDRVAYRDPNTDPATTPRSDYTNLR